MDRTRFQQQQMAPGLSRYGSAPSSYFSTLFNTATASDDFDRQAFGKFIASLDSQDLNSDKFSENQPIQTSNSNTKQEPDAYEQPQMELHKGKFSGQARESRTSGATTSAAAMDDDSYGLMNSSNLDGFSRVKINTGLSNSNLTRFNTSPAGFFAQMDIQNEYGGTRSMGSYDARANPTAETAPMASISETGDDRVVKEETCPGNGHENYDSTFSMPSWDDSDILSDYFLTSSEENPLSNSNASDIQSEEKSRPSGLLSHHLSLPKSSAQLSAVTQDSVPCKVRAKRGCATHPRSIAERVRRTRISERMRKLQELVPNMDKQTNTADMLDFAVDYIKDLELKVKVLSEHRAKCKCSSK